MLSDDIDVDKCVRHEIFCDVVDDVLFDEIYDRNFVVAEETLKWMLRDKTEWLNDEFIENFQAKYCDISFSKLDEVSLLMYEAVILSDEKCIYDVFMAAVPAVSTSFRSKIYLLEKSIFYCKGYFYPYKIFSYLEKEACYCVDYRLLANSLATIFGKHHVIYSEAVKNLLDKSREKMKSDYEKFSLAFSYQRNGYHEEAAQIFNPTIELIIDKIHVGEKDYQAVKSLIIALAEDHDVQKYDDTLFSWQTELSNRLYGAFYNLKDFPDACIGWSPSNSNLSRVTSR